MLLATVKGDVHDIGKNIVGVVLGCNDYDVIDLGVMVPPEKILDTAEAEQVDIVGLSGLITPSLDQMVDVAREMDRRRLELPLMVGGATTSRQHTAVKIAPEYENETVHVLDASRVVDVVAALIDPKRRTALDVENRALQERLRIQHAEKVRKPLLPLAQARSNRVKAPHERCACAAVRGRAPRPASAGRARRRSSTGSSSSTPGSSRASSRRSSRTRPHRSSTTTPRSLLREILQGASLRAVGVYGFWPAHAEGDDVVIDGARFSFLRQQADHGDERPNRCLADYVAPADDFMGAFAGRDPRGRRARGPVRGGARRLLRRSR